VTLRAERKAETSIAIYADQVRVCSACSPMSIKRPSCFLLAGVG
jgi:hypothetical protein